MRPITAVILFASLFHSLSASAQETLQPPRLVVQIVVSQMRYDYLKRFGHNFTDNGLRLMAEQGVNCSNARYGYQGNNTPAGIATLLSGTNPSAHGIVSERWIDYTTNETVDAVSNPSYFGVGYAGRTGGQFAPTRLTVSSVGDEVKRHNSRSRVISIALEPQSSVLGGGTAADAAYWFNPAGGNWCTSTYYMERLPNWVDRINAERTVDSYNTREWALHLLPSKYVYQERSESGVGNDRKSWTFPLNRLFRRTSGEGYSRLPVSPAGMDMMFDFVKKTIVYESLGKDENTDILIITIDPLRHISETYGTESMEVEDAVYRLDAAIGELIGFVGTQIGNEHALFVLTSDHGSSDTRRDESHAPGGLFNPMQFRLLINGFLNTQYGVDNWVLGYYNHNLYLNHRLIFEKRLSLGEIQANAAAFALQFRGVAHAVTGTALQNNHFSAGPLEKMQNGYYPKHSGDIIINLMPGWIEESEERISLTGSIYEYDAHVPLLWYGAGLRGETIHSPVDMTDVAPTLARILGTNRPNAATGSEILPVTQRFAR